MGVQTIVVQSLGELLDRSTPIEPDCASGRLRENSVFRGVSDHEFQLLTALDRLGGTNPPHSKVHLEEHLLRNFIRFGRPFLPSEKTVWEILVTAEHHGLPTRLLDWTHSPLVAAHFATLPEKPATDRVIWKLNWRLLHQHFGIPELAFLVEDLDEVMEERGFHSSWEFLSAQVPKDKHFVCLLDPPAITPRLAVQSGAFTFSTDKSRPLDQLLRDAGIEHALSRFVIPADRVNFIRDQLDLATVDERRLFPGLDGIAAELKRYYSASGD